jgi:16S rRNA (guanine966-N2)-methyltransferase
MRILAGQFKGSLIKYPKTIRPTTDKVRAALFNILGAAVEGARVADLCAGSGAVGLEACSRGAMRVTWIEQNAACARILRENIARMQERAEPRVPCEVVRADVRQAVVRLAARGEQFDLIFLDPPYRDISLLKKALQEIGRSAILSPAGWVVVEHSQAQDLPQPIDLLQVTDSYRYGDTRLTVLKLQEGLSEV